MPDEIDELNIDLRYQDDVIGISRPDLEVTVIIAGSTTVIEFEGDSNPADGIDGAYNVQNEPLNIGDDRLLWPNEEIRILLQFEVERPGTWQLNLRGASFMFLDIIWSEDVDLRDVDEPSSNAAPRMTELDTVHYGALVEDDWDCWTFDVGNHEVLTNNRRMGRSACRDRTKPRPPDLIMPDNQNGTNP